MNKQQALENYTRAVLAYNDAVEARRRTHDDLAAAEKQMINTNQKLLEARKALDAEIIKERGGI